MSGLPEACQLACSFAVTKLEDVFRHLHTGDISYVELQEIKEAKEGMKLLCEASKEKLKTKDRLEYSTNAEWRHTLEGRIEEYEEFENQNNYLLHLCHKVPRHVAGKYVTVLYR